MHKVSASRDIPASPDMLWRLIEDFGNIQAWWPRGAPVNIERVELEGDGVGMIRHIFNEGMPAPVSEQLDALDRDSLSWKLSIVGDRPVGLIRYGASGVITPLSESLSRVEYLGEFEAEPGREEEARQFLLGAYELMFDGLSQAAERSD